MADYTFDSDAEGASASGLPQQTGLTAYAASAFHGARGVRSAGSGTEGRARFAPTGTSVGVREYFRFAGATPGVIAALMSQEQRPARRATRQDLDREKALSKKARVREQIRARKAQKEQV